MARSAIWVTLLNIELLRQNGPVPYQFAELGIGLGHHRVHTGYAGMALMDSLNGSLMSHAYHWAAAKPVRKIYYDFVITGLSVAVALLIGRQEIVSVIVDNTDFEAGFAGWLGNLDVSDRGYVIVGAFAIARMAAIAWWRFTDVEQRWQTKLARTARRVNGAEYTTATH